jgi:hypothetical protein
MGAFTLVELSIVTAIELAVIVILMQMMVSLNHDYRIATSYLSSYLKGREAIEAVSKDSRIATRVVDSFGGYVTTSNCLVLKVPSIDAYGNIIDVNNEFDHIIYRISNSNLWKTVIPSSVSFRESRNAIFKKGVQSLYMEEDGVPISAIAHKSSITRLTIWFSIAENILGRIYEIQPGTTIKLMNYEWESVR